MSDVSGMLWKSSGNGNDKKVKKYYRSVYFNLYIKTFFLQFCLCIVMSYQLDNHYLLQLLYIPSQLDREWTTGSFIYVFLLWGLDSVMSFVIVLEQRNKIVIQKISIHIPSFFQGISWYFYAFSLIFTYTHTPILEIPLHLKTDLYIKSFFMKTNKNLFSTNNNHNNYNNHNHIN